MYVCILFLTHVLFLTHAGGLEPKKLVSYYSSPTRGLEPKKLVSYYSSPTRGLEPKKLVSYYSCTLETVTARTHQRILFTLLLCLKSQ